VIHLQSANDQIYALLIAGSVGVLGTLRWAIRLTDIPSRHRVSTILLRVLTAALLR
jgi:hypothetical protein